MMLQSILIAVTARKTIKDMVKIHTTFLDLANLRFLDYSDTISRSRVTSSILTPKRCVIGFRLAHNHTACVIGESGRRDRCPCMCFRKAVNPWKKQCRA
jgi:hypothetical protein